VVLHAAQKLDVEADDINEIKYWDGTKLDELRLTTAGRWVMAGDQMDGIEDMAANIPSAEHQEIWKQATPLLGQLMDRPNDAHVKEELQRLNEQIVEHNQKHGYSAAEAAVFTIDVDTFSAIFTIANPYIVRLRKSHADEEAAKQFGILNQQLASFNQQHQYPKDWIMLMPQQGAHQNRRKTTETVRSERAAGTTATDAEIEEIKYRRVARQTGYVRDGGRDKKIEGALKAGFGHQIVTSYMGNNGLKVCEIHPASRFGKGFGQTYVQSPSGTLMALGSAASLVSQDLADMAIAGVASVQRSWDKSPLNGWRTEAKTIVLVGFGPEPGQFSWYARSVLGRRFGQQAIDEEIDGYRSDAGQDRPPGPVGRPGHEDTLRFPKPSRKEKPASTREGSIADEEETVATTRKSLHSDVDVDPDETKALLKALRKELARLQGC